MFHWEERNRDKGVTTLRDTSLVQDRTIRGRNRINKPNFQKRRSIKDLEMLMTYLHGVSRFVHMSRLENLWTDFHEFWCGVLCH